MHLSQRLTLIVLSALVLMGPGPLAHAGVVELGVTGNYRRSTINEKNYQESLSYTGSLSYYFWEMSALEFSYTNGSSQVSVKATSSDPRQIIQTDFELMGMDLVITMASRKSAIQPYIKMGGAYIKKKIILKPGDDPNDFEAQEIGSPEGLVPSGGIGLKIRLTDTFSFKVGVDAWTSPLNEEPITTDWAGRAGISMLF